MLVDKQAITIYLDTEVIRLLEIYSNQKRLNTARATAEIVKQFLLDGDNIAEMLCRQDLSGRLDELEAKVLKSDRATCQQADAIEKLATQMAVLEESLERK